MIKYWTKQIGGTLKIDTAKVSDFHIWQTEIPPDLKFFSGQLHDVLEQANALGGLVIQKDLLD